MYKSLSCAVRNEFLEGCVEGVCNCVEFIGIVNVKPAYLYNVWIGELSDAKHCCMDKG